MGKELKQFECKVEERISKNNKPYKVMMVKVNGTWKDIGFVTVEQEFAFYKAGIKF